MTARPLNFSNVQQEHAGLEYRFMLAEFVSQGWRRVKQIYDVSRNIYGSEGFVCGLFVVQLCQ